MLGDAYGAAVVEALSKDELNAMDEEREKERKAQEDEDLESAHAMLDKKWKAVKKVYQFILFDSKLNVVKSYLLSV